MVADMGRFRLTLMLVTLICAVAATAAQESVANDYPPGDARHCIEKATKNGFNLQRLEALPGFGWDNLRNVGEGLVASYNYSECRTTPDGRFLLPDNVRTRPIKSSVVNTFAELMSHWQNWTSSTAKSINANAGLTLEKATFSGKFSADFEDVKSRQIGDKSVTTRAQLRYVRYQIQLQPDTPLDPVFRNRVLGIAAFSLLGLRLQADHLSQLLVRDFGTHVVNKIEAGASLEQVDHVLKNWVLAQQDRKRDILAAASASLFGVFNKFDISASYNTKTDKRFLDEYHTQRTSSNIETKGGPLFRPTNFTQDQWIASVDKDLVALDRAGDPLYFVITGASLPELPQSIIKDVYDRIKDAVEAYYKYNSHEGCLEASSPNFSPSANVEDGSCLSRKPTKQTFGGVYQTCSMIRRDNGDLCAGTNKQVNPLTGTVSCPAHYDAVKFYTTITTQVGIQRQCSSSWWGTECRDVYAQSSANLDTYWCVASATALPLSGYLFGGLYTATMDNPITRSKTCPSKFFALTVAAGGNLKICISDDFEFGGRYSVPFGGFISCQVGNPLAVSSSSVDAGETGNRSRAIASIRRLRKVLHDQRKDWPKQCPDGYSRHLALVLEGCQINYCVGTGAFSGPVIPPIMRPPFNLPPPLPPSSADDNLVAFDPQTNTWKKNQAAVDTLKDVQERATAGNASHASFKSSSNLGSSDSLTSGTAAGIAVGAALACVVLVVLVVLVVRVKRQRSRGKAVDDDDRGSARPRSHVVVNEGGDANVLY